MQLILKRFVLLALFFGISMLGCSERGHAPVYGPGESGNGNNDGTFNIKITDANRLPQLEKDIYGLVNQYRLNIGLSELAWSNTVAKQCRNHSVDIALGNISYGHQGFQERIETIRHNFPNAAGVENIAKHYNSNDLAKKVVEEWLANPQAQEKIEGNFQTTGVGVAKDSNENFYFTQILISQEIF